MLLSYIALTIDLTTDLTIDPTIDLTSISHSISISISLSISLDARAEQCEAVSRASWGAHKRRHGRRPVAYAAQELRFAAGDDDDERRRRRRRRPPSLPEPFTSLLYPPCFFLPP